MSRTALNSPQLFKCSFSRRKKFQTKRLNRLEGWLTLLFPAEKSNAITLSRHWWGWRHDKYKQSEWRDEVMFSDWSIKHSCNAKKNTSDMKHLSIISKRSTIKGMDHPKMNLSPSRHPSYRWLCFFIRTDLEIFHWLFLIDKKICTFHHFIIFFVVIKIDVS